MSLYDEYQTKNEKNKMLMYKITKKSQYKNILFDFITVLIDSRRQSPVVSRQSPSQSPHMSKKSKLGLAQKFLATGDRRLATGDWWRLPATEQRAEGPTKSETFVFSLFQNFQTLP